MPLNLDYFYGGESEQYSFYRIPKVLFTAAHYRAVPVEAKVLYGLLLDRMGPLGPQRLAGRGRRVFIYFTLEDAMAMMGCGHKQGSPPVCRLGADRPHRAQEAGAGASYPYLCQELHPAHRDRGTRGRTRYPPATGYRPDFRIWEV